MKQGWIKNEYGGNNCHYVDDKLHNDNGPAIIFENGSKEWYKHSQLHREDGPAFETSYGYKAWAYNGKLLGNSDWGYTQDQFIAWLKFKAFY